MSKQRIFERALAELESTHKFERIASIDAKSSARELVDMETGRFPMILATEGEASDGHIISVAGIETEARMPLLFGHRSEATAPVLGSVVEPEKGTLPDGTPALRQTGVFNLNGDGPLAAVRRDLAQLVSDGDISKVSFRWDGLEWTRRINLPSDHPAFVDANEVDFEDERYWGVFFARSKSMEGSIVAIGADPQAIVGRAKATKDSASRIFLEALAANVDEGTGLVELSRGFAALEDVLGSLEDQGVKREEAALLLANEATGVSLYRGYAIPKELELELKRRDEYLLDHLLRSGPASGSAEEVEKTPKGASPQGAGEESREADAPRFEDGSIGAMNAERFFDGVSRSMSSAVAGALERVTGRR